MKGVLLVLCTAAVLLAGRPVMKGIDGFIDRYAMPPEKEDTEVHRDE